MTREITPELIDRVAEAIWDGGLLPTREKWSELRGHSLDTMRSRALAAIKAVRKRQ